MTKEVGLSLVREDWTEVEVRRGLKDAPMEWLEENCTGVFAVDYTNCCVAYLSEESDAIAFKLWIDNTKRDFPGFVHGSIDPKVVAMDICGVQPMSGRAGQIFTLKPKYK